MITFLGKDFNLGITEQRLYSDSTPFVKRSEYKSICERADTLLLRPESMSEFFNGISLVHGIHSQGGHIKKLILPYIPGARQDRVNPDGDVLFTLYTVSTMIHSCNFDNVLVVDPHSIQSNYWIDSMDEYPMERIWTKIGRTYDGVISPDKGAFNRSHAAHEVFRGDFVQAEKKRSVIDGKLTGFDVTVKRGRHYIIVDDICDGGGTFVGLGEKIREQGATADLFVTHGIFSKGTDELNKYYQNIYTTNSRDINERNDVTQFDIIKDMIDYA